MFKKPAVDVSIGMNPEEPIHHTVAVEVDTIERVALIIDDTMKVVLVTAAGVFAIKTVADVITHIVKTQLK